MFYIRARSTPLRTYAVMNSKSPWWLHPADVVAKAGASADESGTSRVPLLSQLREQWDHDFPHEQLEALAGEFRTIARCVSSPDAELCASFADMIDLAREDNRVEVSWDGEP